MGGIIATLYLDNRIQSRAAMPICVGYDVARAYKVDKKHEHNKSKTGGSNRTLA